MVLAIEEHMGMVIDLELVVPLDILAMSIAFIFMHPDAYNFPSSQGFDLLLVLHELFISHPLFDF